MNRDAGDTARQAVADLGQLIKFGSMTFVAVWAAWIGFVLTAPWAISDFGSFGDSMAVFGSIATALALAVSARSMLLQQQEMKQQLIEMRGSKEAAEDLAAAQRELATVARLEALLVQARHCRDALTKRFVEVEGRVRDMLTLMDEEARASRAHGERYVLAATKVKIWRGSLREDASNALAASVREIEAVERRVLDALAAPSKATSTDGIPEALDKALDSWNTFLKARDLDLRRFRE